MTEGIRECVFIRLVIDERLCFCLFVSLCAYLHDLVSNNRVATEKAGRVSDIFSKGVVAIYMCSTLDFMLVIASKHYFFSSSVLCHSEP